MRGKTEILQDARCLPSIGVREPRITRFTDRLSQENLRASRRRFTLRSLLIERGKQMRRCLIVGFGTVLFSVAPLVSALAQGSSDVLPPRILGRNYAPPQGTDWEQHKRAYWNTLFTAADKANCGTFD